jgi:two-component system response regulator YesN
MLCVSVVNQYYGGAMYRFLMADDEEIVRRGFESKIDWAEAGFEFLPPCENGRDAMAAIDELKPDVVMTDMPHADGIDVAAHAREKDPGIVVVILSGYDEFSYAQAAIRNNVFDYVLKPVSSRDLRALLAKIKDKLDSDRQSRDVTTHLKEKADRSGDLLRERSLVDIVTGGAVPVAPEAAVAILGFDPSTFSCAAIAAERDGTPSARTDEEAEEIRRRFETALKQARRSAVFFPAEGKAGALVFESDPGRCISVSVSVAAAILEGEKVALRVGVGRTYAQWIDAPRSYAEAQAALAYRLARDASRPFVYSQAGDGRDALAEIKEAEDKLCLCLRSGAASRAKELARSYLRALGSADLSPQRVRHEVLSLFSRAHDELAQIGISSAALSSELGTDFYRLAESLDRPEAVEGALHRLAEIASCALGSSGIHEPEWKVLDFKEFVARHYADRGLSIGKAAEKLSISESYLSKLLKRRLGTSFVEYLADYRIARAKELLASSDMRSYEVAEAVGYPDARYFAAIFKKRSGLTPSEFRASLGRL